MLKETTQLSLQLMVVHHMQHSCVSFVFRVIVRLKGTSFVHLNKTNYRHLNDRDYFLKVKAARRQLTIDSRPLE